MIFLRDFIVYRFVSEDKSGICQIFSDSLESENTRRVFFELSSVDRNRAINLSLMKWEEALLNSPTTSSNPFLKKYAFQTRYQSSLEEFETRLDISNLDSNWEISNKNGCYDSLTKDEATELYSYVHKNTYCCLTFLIGFDVAEGKNCCNPTYGFSRAKSRYSGGHNYLSSSIIIAKASHSKEYSVYVSVETTNKKKQDDSIKEQYPLSYLISVIGEPVESHTFYAPSDEQERLRWNEAKQQYDDQFSKVMKAVPNLMEEYSVSKGYGLTEAVVPGAINTKKILADAFRSTKWVLEKSGYKEQGYKYVISDSSETKFELIFFFQERGHSIQVNFSCFGKRFAYENVNLSIVYLRSKEEVVLFLEKLVVLLEYITNLLKSSFAKITASMTSCNS
jgi:hypothetical protein